MVCLSTVGGVISAILVAYSFARFRWRGRDVIFAITLATMMLPAQVTLIPQYLIFRELGWLNTIKPLWVPVLVWWRRLYDLFVAAVYHDHTARV